ncbi:MAG: metallophosphoesterase [Acidobacteria bacterium]|nr:metallophosphoesterase [Acidobacteriota bacterium]
MRLAEALRLLLFIGIVAAVYLMAAGMLLRALFARLRGRRPTLLQRWTRRLVFSVAIVGLACFTYGYFIEPSWPQVTHVRIPTEKRPPGSRPIRIALISDTHSNPRPRLEERLPGLIEGENPDLILFAGDAINSDEGLPVFKELLTRLSKIAPTFAVRGNWDVDRWSDHDLFGGTGARELDGQVASLEIDSTPVSIVGIAVGSEALARRTLQKVPDGALTIFLHHYPDLIPQIARRNVDLYCAGHTHGGQVALPFYGAIITLSKFGKEYESGLYRVGGTWLYVNRGIGMQGRPSPPVRFFARPEITILELVSPT